MPLMEDWRYVPWRPVLWREWSEPSEVSESISETVTEGITHNITTQFEVEIVVEPPNLPESPSEQPGTPVIMNPPPKLERKSESKPEPKRSVDRPPGITEYTNYYVTYKKEWSTEGYGIIRLRKRKQPRVEDWTNTFARMSVHWDLKKDSIDGRRLIRFEKDEIKPMRCGGLYYTGCT